MLFITKQHLCVHRSDEELDTVGKDELRELLLEKPSNTIYFETADDRLYGMVSYGDVLKEQDGRVPINKSFIRLERSAYMAARERFRKSDTICEIPVVEDGALVGEFHQFDDELLIDRAWDLEFNAYASPYFRNFGSVAIIRPPAARENKMRYFEKLEGILESFGVGYTVIGYGDVVADHPEFSKIFVVDEQERRGVKMLLGLDGEPFPYFHRFATIYDIIAALQLIETLDCGPVLLDLQDQGADVILMSSRRGDSDYAVRTEREMRRRFPQFGFDLYNRMVPYEREFFDDLYDQEYILNIKHGSFAVERYRTYMRLQDTRSKYVNVVGGERVTVGQPDDYTRTIYFFGACLAIGVLADDSRTIESHLQAMINEAGYKVRVVNCGCWEAVSPSVSRILSVPIRKGDVVVVFHDEPWFDVKGIRKFDLWQILEENNTPAEWVLDEPFHANHHVCKQYAKGLFDAIFGEGYQDIAEPGDRIVGDYETMDRLVVQSYFHGVDLSRFDKVACCVMNANPFTKGHRHLLETASKAMDRVYVLLMRDDSSVFSFNERYAMAVDATRDLENVVIIPDNTSTINKVEFPAYFVKVREGDADEQIRRHVEVYASVAKLFHATHRFVGAEPLDPVADGINEASREVLPAFGIETVVVERKRDAEGVISASRVRKLAAEDDLGFAELVPETSAGIIRCEGANVF